MDFTESLLDLSPCTFEKLQEVLENLSKTHVGFLMHGAGSHEFLSSDPGPEMQISSGEVLSVKTSAGVLSGAQEQSTSGVKVLSFRRRNTIIDSYSMTNVLLWPAHPTCIDLTTSSLFNAENLTRDSLAAQGCHIILPSFLSHHAVRVNNSNISEKYPVLDLFGFACTRPNTFSVMNSKSEVHPGTGLSSVTIAAALLGADYREPVYRSCEPISETNYRSLVKDKLADLRAQSDFDTSMLAMTHSMIMCELMSGEGLTAMIACFSQAHPADLLHLPNGLPLLIAFATRLASNPSLAKLPRGSATDQFAAAELNSILEASFCSAGEARTEDGKKRHLLALDVAINCAFSAAARAAAAERVTTAVQDNSVFWHRAGLRILQTFFGVSRNTWTRARYKFGPDYSTQDPLQMAKKRGMRQIFDVADIVPGSDSFVSRELAQLSVRRSILVNMLKHCETWLRTGLYAELQLAEKNGNDEDDEGLKTSIRKSMAADAPEDDKDVSKRFNLDAFSQAQQIFTTCLTQGPLVSMSNLALVSHVVGPKLNNVCADCDNSVDALVSIALQRRRSTCTACSRPRCASCTAKAAALDENPQKCLRCRVAPSRAQRRAKEF